MKRLLTFVITLTLIVIMMPTAVFAKTDLQSEGYHIILEAIKVPYNDGNPVTVQFHVVDKEEWDRNASGYDVESEDYYYDPVDSELSTADYSWEFKNNTSPGTATLEVKGKGDYSGKLSITFEITKKYVELSPIVNSDKSVTLVSDTSFGSNATVKVWDYTLSKGKEYDIVGGNAVISKDFLEGSTSYEFEDLDTDVTVEDKYYSGRASVEAYDISHLKHDPASNKAYTGKNRTTTINPEGASEGTHFVMTYGKNTRKAIGTYTYTAKAIDPYVGSISGTFKIIPKRPATVKARRNSKQAAVSWKKVANCSGYQVQLVKYEPYDTDDENATFYTKYKSKTITSKSKLSYTFKKVKRSKYTHVRVRSYKTVKGTKYYSVWKYKKF